MIQNAKVFKVIIIDTSYILCMLIIIEWKKIESFVIYYLFLKL